MVSDSHAPRSFESPLFDMMTPPSQRRWSTHKAIDLGPLADVVSRFRCIRRIRFEDEAIRLILRTALRAEGFLTDA
jgi:hypothetical protein